MTSGANAISDFIAATNGSVNFGGTAGAVPSRGVSFALWNDPANANGWVGRGDHSDAHDRCPSGYVASGLGATTHFTMTGHRRGQCGDGGCQHDARVSRPWCTRSICTDGVLTVSPIDITTASGLASLTSNLDSRRTGLGVRNSPVRRDP